MRELVRRHVATNLSSLQPCCNEVADELCEPALRPGHVGTSMESRRQVGAVVLVNDRGIRPEHGREPLEGATGPLRRLGEYVNVGSDLALVPRREDRLDTREAPEKRGA